MKAKPTYEELEKELKYLKEKDKSQTLLDVAGVMFVAIDTNGIVTLVNKKACEIFDYEEKEMLGKNWFKNFLPKRIKNEVLPISKKILSGEIEAAEYYENPILTKNGEERLIYWHNTLLRDENENITGLLSSGEDITERKKTEEQFRIIAENTSDNIAITSFDLKAKYLYVSPSVKPVLGYEPEDLLGKSFFSFIHPDDKKKLLPLLKTKINLIAKKILRIDGPKINERLDFRFKNKAGKWRYMQSTINLIGRNLIAVTRDITEHKKAEEALKESEERQRLAQNAGRIGTWEWNVKADSIIWSDMTYKIFGLQKTKKLIKSDDYFNHVHPDDKQRLITELDIALKNKKDNHRTEYRVIKNNKISWIDETSRITTDETGEFTKMIGVIQDITDRKKAEQELQENEVKLVESNKTKDKFFSIIAHDLKSPFTSILGFSELLINNYNEYDAQQHKEFIGIIHQGVQNTHKLLENLLLWSQAQSGIVDYKPEKENLYLLSSETINLMSQLLADKAINLRNEIPQDICVKADKNMLLTILRNLLSNAIKFTPKGGEIVIGAHTITDETNQNYTEISVKDNGVGIPPEIQSGLFKIAENISTEGTEKEQGTGLGLILCKEFVEKHGGKIWVKSKVGNLPDGKAGGSEFKFTIPLV